MFIIFRKLQGAKYLTQWGFYQVFINELRCYKEKILQLTSHWLYEESYEVYLNIIINISKHNLQSAFEAA